MNPGVGTLYLVATPIGNREDITLRALRILREVPLIAAEDTRKTRSLLQYYGITTPLTSYFEHNKLTKLDYLLRRLDEHDVALVSEAGTPGISDPGYELVRAAIAHGFVVTPIPGPSALIAALAASGLPTDRFCFLGFLPRKSGERRRRLAEVAAERATLVLYEAPHRVIETLRDVLDVLGDREMAAAVELTKLYERIHRGTVSELLAYFQETAPRGEFVLVVSGTGLSAEAELVADDATVESLLASAVARGLRAKEAAVEVARLTGRSRREVYDLLLRRGKCDKM